MLQIAVAAAGREMILCEKPLARNYAKRQGNGGRSRARAVPNMVWYNYRRVPAVTLAKQIIDEGVRARFSTIARNSCRTGPFSKLPQGGQGLWRLDADVAGSGVTGDLLRSLHRHGNLAKRLYHEVTAMTETLSRA